jgi:hypothetical protein
MKGFRVLPFASVTDESSTAVQIASTLLAPLVVLALYCSRCFTDVRWLPGDPVIAAAVDTVVGPVLDAEDEMVTPSELARPFNNTLISREVFSPPHPDLVHVTVCAVVARCCACRLCH